jgi:thiamine transporter
MNLAERTACCCRPNEPEPGNTGGGKEEVQSQKKLTLKEKFRFRISTRVLAEVVIFVALATALSFIIIFHLPEGGSITLASMVPILWLALRRGPKIGLFAGAVYGLVQLAVMPQIYYLPQVLLDYPLAFGCLGLAGFFQKRWALAGVTVAITGRFIMHLISGALYFASFAPIGMNPWVYSAIYNGSYLLPELGISLFVIFLLMKSKALKMYT